MLWSVYIMNCVITSILITITDALKNECKAWLGNQDIKTKINKVYCMVFYFCIKKFYTISYMDQLKLKINKHGGIVI